MFSSTNPRRHPTPRAMRRAGLAAMLALALVGGFAAAPARADDVTHLTIPRGQGATSQRVSLGLNKSLIVDLPADAREVIVSQPSIATSTMRSKRRTILEGIGIGDTNMLFLDDKGVQIATLQISVVRDDSTLATAISALVPGSAVKVQAFGDHVVMSGTVLSQDDSDRVSQIAEQFVPDKANVANLITVAGAQQVALKVTVAEVQRDAIKQLGIDLSATLSTGALTTGLVSTPAEGDVSGVADPNTIKAGLNVPGLSLQATLHALEQRGVLRTLDQPTLTAMSGQPAEFLVGGEFPYTTVDTTGNSTTSFKQYGVKLNFTPTIRSNGQIEVLIDTSVSEPAGGGALTERSAKSTVELPPGSTLSIAGLFEDKEKQEFNSLPGIGNIPILGALFRSRDFIHQQTELIILVTPYLTGPGPAPALPTDNVIAAGDAEANFLGHMQKLYGVGGNPGATAGAYHGSVGFALE